MESTYKIIGGDGREYGPASLDELRAWVLDGRVLVFTLVWSSGTELWKPAIELGELESELAQVRMRWETTPEAFAAAPSAGPWPRLAAFMVDFMMISAMAGFLWSLIAPMVFGIEVKPPPELPSQWEQLVPFFRERAPEILFFQAFRLLVEIFFTGRFGATPGKFIAGLRIVRNDGRPIGYGVASLRALLRLGSESVFYLGFIPVFLRADHRSMHDLNLTSSGTEWVDQGHRVVREGLAGAGLRPSHARKMAHGKQHGRGV